MMLLTQTCSKSQLTRGLIGGATALTLVLAAAPPNAAAQCQTTERMELRASDADAFDEFARSVAMNGDLAVIGAPWSDDAGTISGSAFVYRFNGAVWWEQTKLLSSDLETGDEYGIAVAAGDEVIMVGAHFEDDIHDAAGAVYVYRFDGVDWIERAKLLPDGADPPVGGGDHFGEGIDIDGDLAIIAAPADDDMGRNAGAAYIFRYNGTDWTQEAKLLAPDGETVDIFGRSVSISGNVAVVGSHLDDDHGSASGSSYVFRFDGVGWQLDQKLTASDAAGNDQFGSSASIDGDRIVVGAWQDDDRGADSGSAYVYRYDGANWFEQAKLTAFDGASFAKFGISAAVSGDDVLVGAHWSNGRAGAAYAFHFDGDGWLTGAKLVSSASQANAELGQALALDDGVALAGAFRMDTSAGERAGSCFAFNGMTDCNANGLTDRCEIDQNSLLDENANGILDECESPGERGDLNCDGAIDAFDIEAFLLALFQPGEYGIQYPECDINLADTNGDGSVDAFDIEPFLTLLFGP